MKEISNRHFNLLIDKLPSLLAMARRQGKPLSTRQHEDIRQLQVLHRQLLKKNLQLSKSDKVN